MMSAKRLPLLLWAGALIACVAVITQTRFVADLSAFLPRAPNERQQVLVEQLRDGVIARLIMIGIEGGDAAERARLSRALADTLRKQPEFLGVQNGDSATQQRDRAYFFDNRYLLSPAVNPAHFSAEGLHKAISGSIDALAGNAGLIIKRLFPRDPTGETLRIIEQFEGSSQPRTRSGVWASRDGRRALLLVETRAAGSDTDAQATAIRRIREAFADIPHRAAGTRLVMSGAGVFSVSSRTIIEREAALLATAGLVIVIGLLLIIYRSVALLALGLLPVITGALAGITAVSLNFGYVHGLTLGFGTTLIGEAVDYSIYFFMQRSRDTHPVAFWSTIRLGVVTSVTGFAALLFSGFPGLEQLGLYSITGLIAAALTTRYVLPQLRPQQIGLRDLSRIGAWLDRAIASAARLRWLLVVLLFAAAGVLLFHSGPIWNRQLSALSPISKADQRLDMELRRDLGAPDMRYMATFEAPDTESALQGAERIGAVLQALTKAKVIGGFSSPALVLPSEARQRARQAALPGAAQLRANLHHALSGLPVRAYRLDGFLSDVQAARIQKPITRADLKGTSAAFLVDTLLVKRAHDYLVLMPLRAPSEGVAGDEIDLTRVDAALKHVGAPRVTVIDILTETTNLFDSYLHEALRMSGLGSLAIVILLAFSLRSVVRTLRVVIPLACAVLCVTAATLESGTSLTILHLVGLLLVVAVGSNYALFFDSAALSAGDKNRQQTQVSLVVANLTTVCSFGLLGFSSVPVLSYIGLTVALGAFLALVFSAIFTRTYGHASAH